MSIFSESIPDALLKLQELNIKNDKTVLDQQTLSLILQSILVPETVLEIITALNNEIINPNYLLSKSISTIRDARNLIAISLALRYNANPNLYVSVPNFGIVHILVYTYIKLDEQIPNELITSIILMLLYSKSDPMLPAVDEGAGGVKSILDVSKETTVITWIRDKNFPNTIEMIKNKPELITEESMNNLGVQLDNPDLIKSPVNITLVIQFHANKVLENRKNKISNLEYVLSETVEYLNLEAFVKILALNSIVSYFFINDLLLRMKLYYNKNILLSFKVVKNMLFLLIERGIKLDTYQLDIIKETGEDNTKEILEAYQKPYWQKIFNYTGPNISSGNTPNLSVLNDKLIYGNVNNNKFVDVPFDLRLLAYTLGLDHNANIKLITDQIKQISMMEPEVYKTAFIRRQISRISTNSSTPLDFINEPNLEKYIARNIPLMKNINPYEYNELDLGVYKDSNEVVWIFTSDMFDQIINSKKNPYTNDDLPDEFLNNVRTQRSLIKRLGFNINRSLTVSDGLDKMNKQDTVNNDEDERLVKEFEQVAVINGVDLNKLRGMNYQEKHDLLALYKIQINNLHEFTEQHQYVIFCRGCLLYLHTINNQPDFGSKLETFFNSVKMI